MRIKGNEDKGKTGERDPGSERTLDKNALKWEDDIMHVETSFFYSCDTTRTAVFDSQVGLKIVASEAGIGTEKESVCVCVCACLHKCV